MNKYTIQIEKVIISSKYANPIYNKILIIIIYKSFDKKINIICNLLKQLHYFAFDVIILLQKISIVIMY